MSDGEICPICAKGNLQKAVSFSDNKIPLLYQVCDSCGCEQGGPDILEWNRLIYTLYKNDVKGGE